MGIQVIKNECKKRYIYIIWYVKYKQYFLMSYDFIITKLCCYTIFGIILCVHHY